MISHIAFTLFLGLPLIFYGGSLTLLLLLFTATVGFLNLHGIYLIPFKWHPWLALFTIIAAVFHAILGFAFLFGF